MNAMAAICEILYEKATGTYVKFSPEFISAFRLNQNSEMPGMTLREVSEVVLKHGICEAPLLPSNVEWPEILNYTKGKEQELLANAEKYKVIRAYLKIETLEEIREWLKKSPCMIGTAIFRQFFNLDSDHYTLSVNNREIDFAGFHMTDILNDLANGYIECLNSHGPYFGKDGKYLMPYDYFPQFPLTQIFAFTPIGDDSLVKEQLLFYNRSHEPLSPEGLVIHSTATPGATAQNEYVYYNTGERQASAHYFGDWQEIIRCVPENEKAWHAGATANKKYLSYEICEPKDTDSDRQGKFEKTWNNAVWFAADCFIRYGWKFPQVLFSHDAISRLYKETDHTDPIGFFAKYNKSWTDFINSVQKEIDKLKGVTKMEVAVVYWSARDYSVALLVANKLGSCGMFCRNEVATNIHPDAKNAKRLINIGGPEITDHPNVVNKCGAGAADTAILAAEYAKTL